MLHWWIQIAFGAILTLSAVAALIWRRQSMRRGGGYVSIPGDREPADPLLRSQVVVALGDSGPRGSGFREWALGTSQLQAEMEDMGRQLRTLQTYVLELDSRYLRRAEGAWLSLQVSGLVLSIATGVATAIWAMFELASN